MNWNTMNSELALTRRQLFGTCQLGHRGRGARVVAESGPLAQAAETSEQAPAGRLVSPDFRISRRRPSESFFCISRARLRRWICSTTSPSFSKFHGTELPDFGSNGPANHRNDVRSEFASGGDLALQVRQHGQSGAWLSELLPHTAKIVDEITIIKTMNTEAINHDPAITFIQTGSQQPGRPSLGSWVSYGLGSENQNLPAFVVLLSQANALEHRSAAVFATVGHADFCPRTIRACGSARGGEPVLYLADPPGISKTTRRQMLDAVARLNQIQSRVLSAIPEIETRIAQYEMAYRMQTSVPELMDLSKEPDHVFEMYGPDSRKPGTYAANCLLARRLAERNVRFIQLYHRGWDQHNDLPRDLALQCKGTDQASAALIQDLKQRGLLDDTLVVWGGEFGRTVYCQGKLTDNNYGRDHHPRCFAMWLAGGGIKRGFVARRDRRLLL